MYIGHNQYSFAFKCSFAGCIEYAVYGDGQSYTIEHVTERAIEEYWRLRYNGTEEDWNLFMVAKVGTIHRTSSRERGPIPPAVVDAFNAWRCAQSAESIATIRGNPDKYGSWDAENLPDWLQLPKPVHAIHFFYEGCNGRCKASWECQPHCPYVSYGFATTWPLTPFPHEAKTPAMA